MGITGGTAQKSTRNRADGGRAKSVKPYPEEGRITLHRIIERYSRRGKGLSLLYEDISDTRQAVVLSALHALGKVGDRSCLDHIRTLFEHREEIVRVTAIMTAGEIGSDDFVQPLIALFDRVQEESIRVEILRSLSKLAPDDPKVLALHHLYAQSSDTGREGKAFATGFLLTHGHGVDFDGILHEAQNNEHILEELLHSTEQHRNVQRRVVARAIELRQLLSVQNRVHILEAAASLRCEDYQSFLLESLSDPHPEIRTAGYRLIGANTSHWAACESLISHLMAHVELNPGLEEEVYGAIERIAETSGEGNTPDFAELRHRLMENVETLFEQLREPGRKIFSDTHELGWLIVRSKEYLEYYGSESLKDGLVQFLRSRGKQSKIDLLRMLKDSAVKIEARHVEGYHALIDIIKNPDRSGASLIARELVLAKIGKGETMYRLMRNLHLSRILKPQGAEERFREIFAWARVAKLYGLAETAMYALSGLDRAGTSELCVQCLTPPIESKSLAVASIKLLKNLEWDLLEPKVINLISQTSDQFILVKLIDALTASAIPVSVELIIVLMGRMVFESDQEALFKLSGILSSRADYDIIDGLMNMYDYAEKAKKPVILRLIGGLSFKKETSREVGLREFLRRILDKDSLSNKTQAATLLYRMGEEGITDILHQLLSRARIEDKTEMIRGLYGEVKPDLLPSLIELIHEPNGFLHEALREILLSIDEEETVRQLLEQLAPGDAGHRIGYEGGEQEDTRDPGPSTGGDQTQGPATTAGTGDTAPPGGSDSAEQAVVLYAGIYQHDKKVKLVSQPETRELVKEYESILLSVFTKQGGTLVKRMEGGYLFHFQSPLFAVLAASGLQESMERFRDNNLFFRLGIHLGSVEGETGETKLSAEMIATLLGNTASDGSMLFSQSVHEAVGRSIGSTSVGAIRLKGIENPIKVYEPSGTIENGQTAAASQPGGDTGTGGSGRTAGLSDDGGADPESTLLRHLSRMYKKLHSLTYAVERGERSISSIREEITKSWDALREIVKTQTAAR
jgi:class 3 adenylate cyclase/HEAT repeat protein